MPANRLKLDFSIQTTDGRRDFVNEYVQLPQFQKNPLNESELETIANYILWGKDPDGLNVTQRGEIQIETRNKTWQRDDTESLDALMESPTFSEASLRRPTEARTRVAREVFDRKKTLKECPEHLVPVFQDLFDRIDYIELQLNFYEFAHGKRKEPPRESLQKRFTEAQIANAQTVVAKWNQFKYLKQRHLIVELRREQFTLRDTYIERHVRHTPIEPEIDPVDPDFDAEIPVFPLGLKAGPIGALLFKDEINLNPSTYSESDLQKVLQFYWDKKSDARPAIFFDFANLEHIYELFGQLNELEESVGALSVNSNLSKLLETLKYYIGMTDLTEAQREILDLKINKVKNQDIADAINKKYGKSYTANYISTIFRQKIIPRINETAEFHAKIVENLSFPENFKKCTGCGKVLLIDPDKFVRKSRSKDGFSTRCKICDRNDRQKKKVK